VETAFDSSVLKLLKETYDEAFHKSMSIDDNCACWKSHRYRGLLIDFIDIDDIP